MIRANRLCVELPTVLLACALLSCASRPGRMSVERHHQLQLEQDAEKIRSLQAQIEEANRRAEIAESRTLEVAVHEKQRARIAAEEARAAAEAIRASEEAARRAADEDRRQLEQQQRQPPPPPLPPRTEQEPSLPPGVKGVREVFFATDRRALGDDVTFGNEASPQESISYGRVFVSIPERHEIGSLERPWQFLSIAFPEDAQHHIVITTRRLYSADEFFTGVGNAINVSPEKSAFVFVHGFNVSFDEAVLRTGQLAWDLKFKGPVVAFSWPSAHRTLGYVRDIDLADWTMPHLESFLRELRRRTGAHTVHLIAHSMGSRVMTRALERLAHFQDGGSTPHFQELVLAAPDINQTVFQQLAKSLQQTADRVTIYSSRRDIALWCSAFLRRENARVGAGIKPPFPNFDVIDATAVRSSLLGHSYFADSVNVLNDLALLLRERLGPDKRSVSLQLTQSLWTFRP